MKLTEPWPPGQAWLLRVRRDPGPRRWTQRVGRVDWKPGVNADNFSLENFLPYRLVRLSDQLSQLLAEAYRDGWDLGVAEWRVLSMLNEVGPRMSKELCALTYMDKARVSRAVTRLLERGLLERRRHGSDSRAYYVDLTAPGRSVVRSVIPEARRWEADLFSTLDDKERAMLFRILGKLDESTSKLAPKLEACPKTSRQGET